MNLRHCVFLVLTCSLVALVSSRPSLNTMADVTSEKEYLTSMRTTQNEKKGIDLGEVTSRRSMVKVFVEKQFHMSAGLSQYQGTTTTSTHKGHLNVIYAECPVGRPISCFCLGLPCTWVHGVNVVNGVCQCDYWGIYGGCHNVKTTIKMICTNF